MVVLRLVTEADGSECYSSSPLAAFSMNTDRNSSHHAFDFSPLLRRHGLSPSELSQSIARAYDLALTTGRMAFPELSRSATAGDRTHYPCFNHAHVFANTSHKLNDVEL